MEQNSAFVENNRTQMRRGVLEYSILLVLQSGEGYTSSIIAKLKEVNMIVVEGTLYPLLIRLKNQGLLTYRWEESPQGPPRKYYTLTEKGAQELEGLDKAWNELVSSIEAVRNMPKTQNVIKL